MLSSPPLRFAVSTSSRAAASRLSRRCSTTSRITSFSTMDVKPSEQMRKRSPTWGSTVNVSTSTSGSVPSARVITERCGWISASSGESLPLRTSSATSEWSSVSCSMPWSRIRYARESPTCPNVTLPSSTRARVIVVPMPEALASSDERSKTRRFASWTSATTRSSPLPSAAVPRAEAASREAISPPLAPPIPSATAKIGGSQTHESSFRRRLRPGWERPVERPIFIGRSGSRFPLRARDLPAVSLRGRDSLTPFK